ncbi:50S ribosomal protein L23 [Candidatus Symbiobacter mobilis]|uniref:Large ribosomal subunit protein uL23 n=1 Tax=Candidatus Symbiobacter mobilis CR TaxID=946483 RepID=U5N4T6_9BURK|nr:50S ribosomal protein L23 [Candidatus Symbiobacter mobilis]AGX86511.1 ribosomal protein L23 [Candidatus Symbiobacter mobilis CR]
MNPRNIHRSSSQDRLMQVLIEPWVTEKATNCATQQNTYIFRVLRDATKLEVKAAVELLLSVQVTRVTVANVRGKLKRRGNQIGRRAKTRKAFVTLAPGNVLHHVEGVS